jgi:hypothetical protein
MGQGFAELRGGSCKFAGKMVTVGVLVYMWVTFFLGADPVDC